MERLMKSKIFYVISASVLIIQFAFVDINYAMATEEDDVRNVVVEFLQDLKKGNTTGVLELITDPMLSEREVLLQHNPNYPRILVNAYKNTEFEVSNIEKIDDLNYSVDINYLVDNEAVKKTTFICQKNSDVWKVSEEIRD